MAIRTWAGLLALCAPALAGAKTPDGQPPSVETVCDGYHGAAFGLCNAYCEAMDCDFDPHHAADPACTRVRDHFLRITGEAAMPCEGCPTYTCTDAGGALTVDCDTWAAAECQYWGTRCPWQCTDTCGLTYTDSESGIVDRFDWYDFMPDFYAQYGQTDVCAGYLQVTAPAQ